MESGLSVRLTTKEALEMITISNISIEFKDFAKETLKQMKTEAKCLGDCMFESDLFPKELSYVVNKTENYIPNEFSKTFGVFSTYFNECELETTEYLINQSNSKFIKASNF